MERLERLEPLKPMDPQQNLFDKAPRWRPANFDASKLTSEEDVVLSYLKILHVGAKRAIKQSELARCCHMDDRKLQLILKHLTETHHVGLASSVSPPYGVYLIDNEDEAIEYCKQLHNRALSTLRREAVIKRVTLPALLGQLSLEAGE